jgi:hypothetical protein
MNEEILNNIWNILSSDSSLNIKAANFDEWKNSFAQDKNIQTNVYNYLKQNHTLKAANQEEWTTSVMGKTKGSADATPGVEPIVTESGLDVGTLDLPETTEEASVNLLAISNGVTENHVKVKRKLAEKYFSLDNFKQSRVKVGSGTSFQGYARSEEDDLKSWFGEEKYEQYLQYKQSEVFDSKWIDKDIVKQTVNLVKQEEAEQYITRIDDEGLKSETRTAIQEGVFNIFDPEDASVTGDGQNWLQQYTDALKMDKARDARIEELGGLSIFRGRSQDEEVMKLKAQGSQAEKVLANYFNHKFTGYQKKSKDWNTKYNDYIKINKTYEPEFNRIGASINALGKVDEYSSKEKIEQYNNLIAEGNNLTAEYQKTLLDKNLSFEDISNEAISLRSGFDKIVDNYDKVTDAATVARALALDYGVMNNISLSFETGIAEMGTLLSGTLKGFAWAADKVHGAGDALLYGSKLPKDFLDKDYDPAHMKYWRDLHEGVIDYNESLQNYKQSSLPLNIDWDDVGMDNIGTWSAQALGNNAFSIASALTYGGAIKMGMNVPKATKVLSATFFGLEGGAKLTHMEIDQDNAGKYITDLQESLKFTTTKGERVEILDQIDYYEKALSATEMEKAFSSTLYGGIAMYAERLGTMRYMRNLARTSPTTSRLTLANSMKGAKTFGMNTGIEYVEEFVTQVGHNLVDMTVLDQNKNLLDGIDNNFNANIIFSTMAIQGPSGGMNVFNTLRSEVITQGEILENRKRTAQIIETNNALQADQESGFKLLDTETRKFMESENRKLMREAGMKDAEMFANVANMTAAEVKEMLAINQKKRDKLKQIQNLGASSAYEKAGDNYIEKQKEKLVNDIKNLNGQRDQLRGKPGARRKEIIEATLKNDKIQVETEFYLGKAYAAKNIVKGLGNVKEFGKINEDGTIDLTDLETYLDKKVKKGNITEGQKKEYLKGFRQGHNASFVGNDVILIESNMIRNINNAETALEKSIHAYSVIHELQHINDVKTGLVQDLDVVESSKVAVEGIQNEVETLYKQGKIKEKDYATFLERVNGYTRDNGGTVDLMELLTIAGELKDAGVLSENSTDPLLSLKLMINQFSNKYFKKGEMFFKLNSTQDVLGYIDSFQRSTRNQTLVLGPEEEVKKPKFSKMTTAQKAKVEAKVDKLGQVDTDGNNLQEKGMGNFYYQAEVDNIIKEINKKRTDKELGLENEGYLDNLIAAKYKVRPVPDKFVDDVLAELTKDIRGFKPEENNSLFGYLQGRISFRAGDVYKEVYEKKGPKKTIAVEERTKEGEVRIQLEADIDPTMEALETEDMSPAARAKKEKVDKQRYSEYRQKLGFETGSKIYNEVLDNVKKSLMMAYGATQNITDAQLRAQAIAAKLKKEYANLDSPLFKQIKNFLTYGSFKKGTKDIYFTQLKKFREDIVKNISTADLVQIERKTPDVDKIFVKFVKKLTKISEVEDAVNKEKLPPEALNKITKDKKTGKGSFSPSLYDKIMPTETELISWADQPGINPVTGARQGLKGTRKDGLVMRMVNGLVTDAIMEARQSEEVQSKIAEMGIDPGSVAELGAAIGREVNVKFSKSNAIGDVTAAIDGVGDVNVYSQIKFSKAHRDVYEKQLTKRRPDLTEDQRKNAVQSVFDFVDGKGIPNNKKSKYEKMAMHYMANGHLILPEDGYKVIEAERLATQKKIDPFSFKNPNVLIETYVGEVKGTRTNPDNVKTFSNKTELTNGVTVYDVEDSKQGQKDVRKVIDTHFGKKSNPWCLAARQEQVGMEETIDGRENAITFRDGLIDEGYVIEDFSKVEDYGEGEYYRIEFTSKQKGELGQAWQHWKQYNQEGNGHKIAFHDGKLIAFRDGNNMEWWDRNDKSTSAPVIRGKKDKDGFKPVSLVYKNKSEVIRYEKVTGDKKNGTTILKDGDGDFISQETKKNGRTDGVSIEVDKKNKRSNDYNLKRTQNFKEGQRLDFKEERTYNNSKALEAVNFGRHEIRVDNITKYDRSFTERDWVMETETITIEGTVNQKYFEEFQDPSKLDGFEKNNLKYLTPTHQRYYGIQGEKVKIVKTTKYGDSTDGTGKTTEDVTVTINGVKQEIISLFSDNDVKFSLTSRRESILLPSYVNKKIKELKEKENITAPENQVLDILEVVQDLYDMQAVEVYNTLVEQFPSIFNNLQESDFKNQKSFIAALERNNQTQMKVNGYITSKKVLQKQTENLSIEKGVELIAEYLTNVGRDVRSALIVKTNKGLKIDLIDTLQNGRFKKYFKAEETFKGSGKYKIVYAKDGKNFENVEIYESVENIKNNIRKDKSLVKTVNEQAEKSQEYRLKTLDPKNKDLTLGDKLDFIELTNTGTKGSGRKAAKIDVTVTDKSGLIAEELVLEHEITIKNMKSYERAYAKGDISKEQMREVYQQNKVHVLPKSYKSIFKKLDVKTGKIKPLSKGALILKKIGIKQGVDDILALTGKASQRQGMGYESINELSLYFESLFNNGLINKMPESLQDSFNRKSNSFKNAVRFSRSTNNESKGITVLDFDDTLATSKSLIRFTRPDGTKGTLNAEQYASTYQELTELGYQWDFSEFNKVVDGKTAPLFNKAMKLQGKFGPENMFVLTARPAESAAAIHAFLKANGLNIPLKNITGLANSTAEAKALWIAEKVGEGYNDFYFADDAIQNVQAVDNMLKQFDVKRKIQQARVKFSQNMDTEFNNILENITGIESKKRFSIIKGRKRGESKGKFRFFIPPSHEDFVGLLYNFMGKGKEGNKHRDFFEQALVRPLNRAYRELNTAKQSIANDYKSLNKQFKDVKKKLTKKTPDGDFTFQDAIRVYLWDKHGHKIPGLSETDQTKLAELVMSDPQLQAYAENINIISKQETYVNPTESWEAGDIRIDLDNATGRVGRGQFFTEFNENSKIIFSEENFNKIEAAYGANVVSAIKDILYRTKTGRNRPSGQNELTNKFMNYLNGSVGATMFFNVRSMVLQQMSMVNFINFADNNIFSAAKAFANQPQYYKDWAYIFNSDFMKQRRSGIKTDVNGAELAASLKGNKNTPAALLAKLLEIGFLPTQIGDNVAIATGGATFYRNRVNTYLKQGLSQKEAETKAWTDFEALAEATQQSARPDMVSQQQASPLGKIILAFQNVTSQFNRIGKKAFLDIKNRRITPGNTTQFQSDVSNLSRISYYFAIQNLIFYSLQSALFMTMFDDDEEDDKFLKKKERIINGSIDSVLRGTGVWGAIVATLKNMAIKNHEQRNKKYNPDESSVIMEMLNVSPPLGIKARKMVNAEKTLNYNKDVIKEMETFDIDNPMWSAYTSRIEAITNIPVNRLYNKTQNVRQSLNNQHSAFLRALMFGGWSQWNLGIENKKMEDIKSDVKEKKKKEKKSKKKKPLTREEIRIKNKNKSRRKIK